MALTRNTKPREYYTDSYGTHPIFDINVYGDLGDIVGDLDDIDDGTTYGRVKQDQLNDGHIINGSTLPVGVILMYDGNGIADADTRTEAIGERTGDTISMPGWYVCNGQSGTPDLRNKFIRSESVSGNTGGSDDAVVVSHNHTGSTGGPSINSTGTVSAGHTHYYYHWYGTTPRGLSSNLAANNVSHGYYTGGITANHTHSMQSHTHSFTTSTNGVDGTGKNMPAYYSLIFIKKMS